MTSGPDRLRTLELVDGAVASGAGRAAACRELGLAPRTLKRWRKAGACGGDGRPGADRPRPDHALTAGERERILKVCNEPEHASKPPGQIVPALADRGEYLGSESTFYRVLRADGQAARRGSARAPSPRRPPATHVAEAPGQVWVWDITWLMSLVTGMFWKLYIIMDLHSRKIVAWEVWPEENAEHAKELVERAALAEGIAAGGMPLVLHGDNGGPLKAATLRAKLMELGISPSHSRPRVSNDNAHAEALFRTVKYHPSIPAEGFGTLEEARAWVMAFVAWYNHEHRHSALNHVTPHQKHTGEDATVLARRAETYEQARAENPRRWIRGRVRRFDPAGPTALNPLSPRDVERRLKRCA